MRLQHVTHKHGGKIVDVYSVGHETHKGVADWFFLGKVEWSDGTVSEGARIAPWALCADQKNADAQSEINALLEAMNSYLRKHGAWHEPKRARDGRMVHWTPKRASWTQHISGLLSKVAS